MKIKKGSLNYDQSGRAYPNNPRIKENWECIWEHDGKYYQLVGDDEHKEWSEVNIYNQIIDDAYKRYLDRNMFLPEVKWLKETEDGEYDLLDKEEFINKIKTDKEFADKWGLTIEERELTQQERYEHLRTHKYGGKWDGTGVAMEYYNSINVPTKLITITYNETKIETYE